MPIMSGGVATSSFTHTGIVRKRNEDALLALPKSGIWAVADGMGGHDEGDFASHCIISHLHQTGSRFRGSQLVNTVPASIQEANREILLEAARLGDDAIIGTTIVVLILDHDLYHCYWCGDSRCYLLRDEQLTAITRDHTHAEAMRAEGSYSDIEILNHPSAHALVHAVGVDQKAQVDYTSGYIYEGDRFLLCSDGLTKVYSHDEIRQRIQEANIDQVNLNFLSDALDAGAPDNISSVLVSL